MEQFLYERKIKKNPKINCILAFPGVESFAMSSIGYLSIFKDLDLLDEVYVERYYSNSTTTSQHLENTNIIGFSSSFELDFLQILKILEKLKIPFLRKDRSECHPLVFAGGPVITSNPLPYQDFFDFVNIGDSNLEDILSVIAKNCTLPKAKILNLISDIEGVWVCENGTSREVRRSIKPIIEPVYTSILSDNAFFKNTFIVEIERGCPKMCNFCTASWHNMPVRYATKEKIIEAIDFGLKYTRKIALLGAYVAGHPDFDEILDYIKTQHEIAPIELTLSSLRADLTNKNTVETLVKCGAKTATIAFEAGSDRLRKLINKDLTVKQIKMTVQIAREGGLKGLKMYAMIGFPTEVQEDIDAIVSLMRSLKEDNKGFDLSISLNTFIPKPHTPFQMAIREDKKSLESKINYLKKELHKIGVKINAPSVDWDGVQSLLSRYPESMSEYLIDVYNNGGKLGAFKQCWKKFSDKKYDDAVLNPAQGKPWDFVKVTNS